MHRMYEATRAVPEAGIRAGVTRVSAEADDFEEYPEAEWVPVSNGPSLFVRSEYRDTFGRWLVDEAQLLEEMKERMRTCDSRPSRGFAARIEPHERRAFARDSEQEIRARLDARAQRIGVEKA